MKLPKRMRNLPKAPTSRLAPRTVSVLSVPALARLGASGQLLGPQSTGGPRRQGIPGRTAQNGVNNRVPYLISLTAHGEHY